MKKKIGINIMLFVIILIVIINLSCSRSDKNRSEGALLKADSDFSGMSVKEGMFKAFLFFMAEDGVILRDNSYPSKGKDDLRKRFEGRSDTSFVLSWEPVYEKIAESGDLGYTYGIHSNLDKATGKVTKGTYITIWKKQSDESWKFVLDAGTQGLPE